MIRHWPYLHTSTGETRFGFLKCSMYPIDIDATDKTQGTFLKQRTKSKAKVLKKVNEQYLINIDNFWISILWYLINLTNSFICYAWDIRITGKKLLFSLFINRSNCRMIDDVLLKKFLPDLAIFIIFNMMFVLNNWMRQHQKLFYATDVKQDSR